MKLNFPIAAVMLGEAGGWDGKYINAIMSIRTQMPHSGHQKKCMNTHKPNSHHLNQTKAIHNQYIISRTSTRDINKGFLPSIE